MTGLAPSREADGTWPAPGGIQRWAAPGPFGITTMPLGAALGYIASQPDFWTNA